MPLSWSTALLPPSALSRFQGRSSFLFPVVCPLPCSSDGFMRDFLLSQQRRNAGR